LGSVGKPRHERTTDSYVLNGTKGDVVSGDGDNEHVYSALVVDEMPMHHDGQVVAAIRRSGAGRVVCFGDLNQITFQTFSATFKASHSLNLSRFMVKYMSVVHRCRNDAIAAWQDRYFGTLRACTCCKKVRETEKSMKLVRMMNVSDLVYKPGVRYLTFTHVERMKLLKHFGEGAAIEVLRERQNSGFATVQEDQGETHHKVVLVRLEVGYTRTPSEYSPSIYNRLAHALTATTRHDEEFEYWTASGEVDEVTRRIDLAKCQYRLAVTRGEVLWRDVKDRAVKARVMDATALELKQEWFADEYTGEDGLFS